MNVALNRRTLLKAGGALVVLSRYCPVAAQEAAAPATSPKLPGSLNERRFLDSWIRVDADARAN
ncbi:hypothetical protein D3227_26290 [Mesorhizobium waimense]|uniref:Uncharacterized protein n=1 Tax=Mesorhizobium waimense TaxID=1300307 RepID=A0A3A5KED2_9HYPH|nr:hypothetical protein D3227_26290 [Mesorhizobium waimense]